MHILQDAHRAEFRRRLTERLERVLRERGTQQSASIELLTTHIRRGLKRAEHFGLVAECDVAEYIEIMCLFFGGFESKDDPLEVIAFLGSRGGDPGEKLRRLREWASEEARSATRRA